jgi:transposase-like protein
LGTYAQEREAEVYCRLQEKVGLEALKGQSTVAEIAKSNQLHPSQILDWKKTLSERSEELFATKANKASSTVEDNASLYEQIGRLEMEVSFLKKKLGQ